MNRLDFMQSRPQSPRVSGQRRPNAHGEVRILGADQKERGLWGRGFAVTLAHAQFDRNVTWGFSTNEREADNLNSDLLLHRRLSAGAFKWCGEIFLT